MNIDQKIILELEIRNILNSQFSDVYDSGTYFNFRCNVCGDSKNNKFKKRGHIYYNQDPWSFHCFRCQTHYNNIVYWMKEYYPFNYRNYLSEVIKNKVKTSDSKPMIEVKKYTNIKTRRHDKEVNEKDDVKFFKKIKDFPNAIEFCKNRRIPEETYLNWFYATDGSYKNRIIIPARDDKGKIYYYQGRTLIKHVLPKYKSRKGEFNSIYNYFLVDRTKPVSVLEGPIDSGFVENSIAVTGLKVNKIKDIEDKRFLLDNDKAGKEQSLKLLEDGEYVFNWTLFLKEYVCKKEIKDVNDFVMFNKDGIQKLTWEIIEKFYTNNFYDKIYFV